MNPIIDRTYRLHAKLGQGGMGTVFSATEIVSGKWVALKLVSAPAAPPAASLHQDVSYKLALTREFQTLASLHHPHLIRVLSYGFDEQHGSYYTMELLEQAQTIIEAAREQSELRIAELLAQLLRALAYIHQRGILHRDIKPSNVLVCQDEVKLLDFGIAVHARENAALAGTVEYLAPELLLGQTPSTASDLYSVGVLAYQMLTGRFPYGRDSMTRILQGILGTHSEFTLPKSVLHVLACRRRSQTAAGRRKWKGLALRGAAGVAV